MHILGWMKVFQKRYLHVCFHWCHIDFIFTQKHSFGKKIYVDFIYILVSTFLKSFFLFPIAFGSKWNQYTCRCTSVQKIVDHVDTLQSFEMGHHLHPQVLYRVLFSIVLSIVLSIKVNHIIYRSFKIFPLSNGKLIYEGLHVYHVSNYKHNLPVHHPSFYTKQHIFRSNKSSIYIHFIHMIIFFFIKFHPTNSI